MRPGLLLGSWAATGALPVALLLGLAASGAAAPSPTLAAAGLTAAGALLLGLVWTRDLARLRAKLRPGAASGSPPPVLPALRAAAQEIDALSRALAERAALAERRGAADAAIVAQLPDPLIELDAGRAVRRVNAAARTAFGAETGALLRHPTLRAALDRAGGQDGMAVADLSLPGPPPRELQATVIRLDLPPTEDGRLLVVLSDRTRDRAVERMRADFVANVSHELRTPLASVTGFIDTLRGSAANDPPAQARFLGIMAEQAARMTRLIDDLLGLARIELTEHQPPTETVDLAAVIRRVVAALEPRIAAARARLDLSLAADLPPVAGDADQLAQVVQNLLDNAVKYGGDGGAVRIAAGIAGADPLWPPRPGVVLAVADRGPGIPRAHLPRLTERFYRVDKGRSRAVGGTGLGLAIVKHILNRHRGQLRIDSGEGEGSTFSVWLPAAAAVQPELQQNKREGVT